MSAYSVGLMFGLCCSGIGRYILPVVHGFIQQEVFDIKVKPTPQQRWSELLILIWQGDALRTTLVSRRSRHRAGSRFYARGIDRANHVANFVETEQILEQANNIAGFVQARGSVPLIWNQPPGDRCRAHHILNDAWHLQDRQ